MIPLRGVARRLLAVVSIVTSLLLALVVVAVPGSARATQVPAPRSSGTAQTPVPRSTGTAQTPVPRRPRPPQVPAGFVYRQGRNLMLDGAPYRFVGFNAFGMSGCATGQPWTDDQLDAYFAGLPPASMTRTWAFASYDLGPIDSIVKAAAAHGQKLILTLANAGKDCGETAKTTDWYAGGYQATGDRYLPWVDKIVSNFADSPAVAIWEIMNEPGNGANVDNDTMKAFFDDVAARIKSIDPNHLVGTGSMAEYTPGTTDYAYVHSGPDIDVGSLHEYDYDPTNDTLLHRYFSRHVAPTLDGMYRAGKPLIIGETGVPAGTCPKPAAASLADRAQVFHQKFDGYLLQGVAGVLIWDYTPNPSAALDANCERVRADPPDPTIAMVHDYVMPTPVAAPVDVASVVVQSSGKCLDVPAGSTANYVVIDQQPCSGAAYQRFQFQPTDGGFYEIVAQHSGKCLDVTGQSLTDKATIQQYDCWGGGNQQFRLMPTGDGTFYLIARSSVKCAGMTGGSADGGVLVQYTCYSTDNYKMTLRP